ncbi:hypothetical protein BH23DEI1_BH23DEI1_07850 [soil metagenome]
MPVRRYRDVAEMPGPRRSASALAGLAAACAASSLSRAFGTFRQAPRGVRRFRSVEEADAHRQRWESGAAGDVAVAEPARDGR